MTFIDAVFVIIARSSTRDIELQKTKQLCNIILNLYNMLKKEHYLKKMT